MSRRKQPGNRSTAPSGGTVFLYGRHPVAAALDNADRRVERLYATVDALAALKDAPARRPELTVETVDATRLRQLAGPEAPHQGVVLKCRALPSPGLEAVTASDGASLIVVLDQVTDPQNVGAIMRSAAAFGATGIVTTARNAPGESGALARAASGALDRLPWLRLPNLARALDDLADAGFWRIGLDAAADRKLGDLDLGDRLALVLGAEGRGLRPLTKKHCDLLVRIPIARAADSLNVAGAAAVALYVLAGSA